MIPPSDIDTARNLLHQARANRSQLLLTKRDVIALDDELTNLAADLSLESTAADRLYDDLQRAAESLRKAEDREAELFKQVCRLNRDLQLERQFNGLAETIINNLTDELEALVMDRREES